MAFGKKIGWSILLILMVALLGGCSSEQISKDIEADVHLGHDGTIKISASNPLVAVIRNSGPAFEGELQIDVDENPRSKTIIAQSFEIAENATKEIAFEVPVYIIQKTFDVRIVSKGKTVYKAKVSADQVLPPNRSVIAVITDAPDTYRFLENMEIADQYADPYAREYAMKGGGNITEKEELQVIYFDSLNQLDSSEKLSFFNYIYLGENQSLTISQEQEESLINWVNAGNELILETGANFKKTNSMIPESLNPIQTASTQRKNVSNLIYELSLNDELEIAQANSPIADGVPILGEDKAPIVALTQMGQGQIVTLFVNLSLEPLASWSLKAPFMEEVFEFAQGYRSNVDRNEMGEYSQFEYMVNRLPIDKKPPYLFMFLILAAYVLIAAPIGYIILKKMDKRDYAWIGIPLLSLLCVLTLYLYGAGSRYEQGIINSISVITSDDESDSLLVKSDMMIFNNENNLLRVDWGDKEEINLRFSRRDDYYMYNTDPQGANVTKTASGKLLYGNRNTYEKYDAKLWSSNYVSAEKIIPMKIEDMVKLKLSKHNLMISVKNTTPYELKDAFVKWGQGFIYIGDLEPGQEKSVEQMLTKALSRNFDTFVRQEMGYEQPDYSQGTPKNIDKTAVRLYEILMQRYVYYGDRYGNGYNRAKETQDLEKVTLCALNYQDIGYDIRVNNDDTIKFSTNLIEIDSNIEFEKDSHITLPMGIISPAISYYLSEDFTNTGSFDYQAYDQFIRFYEQGIAAFEFHLPKSIELDSAKVEIGELYSEEDFYNQQNGQKATPKEVEAYQIYNNRTNTWENVDRIFEIDSADYINREGVLSIRVDIRQTDGTYDYVQMMKAPNISIEGGVK